MNRLFIVCIFLVCAPTLKGQTDTSASCIPAVDTIDGQKVFLLVDKMPQFPEGEGMLLTFLSKNLRYPNDFDDFQGSIYVTFIVDTTGQIRNACIYKRYFKGDLSPIEEEALRVINAMPKWIPGQKEGKKVPVRITLPIKFTRK